MGDYVRTMHETSGLLDQLDKGVSLLEAEEQVLTYVREQCGAAGAAAAGRQHRGDRPVLPGPGHADAGVLPALPDRRRLLDQGAVAAVVPPRLLPGPGQAREPPGARGHPGEHRGAALLPGHRLRAGARARTATRPARSPRGTPARSPACTATPTRPRRPPIPLPRAERRTLFPGLDAAASRLMVGIAQPGRAPRCGRGCRGFESRYSPQASRTVGRDRPAVLVVSGSSRDRLSAGRGCARSGPSGSPRRPPAPRPWCSSRTGRPRPAAPGSGGRRPRPRRAPASGSPGTRRR